MKNNKVHPDSNKQDEESTQQEEIVKSKKLEVMKLLQVHYTVELTDFVISIR